MWHHKSSASVNVVSGSHIFQTLLHPHSIISCSAWMSPGGLIQQVSQVSNQLLFLGWAPRGSWRFRHPVSADISWPVSPNTELMGPLLYFCKKMFVYFPHWRMWGKAKIAFVYFTGSAVRERAGCPSLFLNQDDSMTFHSNPFLTKVPCLSCLKAEI